MADRIEPRLMTASEYVAAYPTTNKPMELINGEIIMSPSPTDRHADIVANLMWVLQQHIRLNGLGKVKTEPVDVHLDETTVLQPDVIFIHQQNTRCVRGPDGYLHGPPDLVIEVLSPATAKHGQTTKYDLYEKSGVREYWLVYPDKRQVEVFALANTSHYSRLGVFAEGDTFAPSVLPQLSVTVADIFENIDS